MFHRSCIFDFYFLVFIQTRLALALVPGRKFMGILATCYGSDHLVGTNILH